MSLMNISGVYDDTSGEVRFMWKLPDAEHGGNRIAYTYIIPISGESLGLNAAVCSKIAESGDGQVFRINNREIGVRKQEFRVFATDKRGEFSTETRGTIASGQSYAVSVPIGRATIIYRIRRKRLSTARDFDECRLSLISCGVVQPGIVDYFITVHGREYSYHLPGEIKRDKMACPAIYVPRSGDVSLRPARAEFTGTIICREAPKSWWDIFAR